jgi:hypothetical protein
MTSLVDKIIRRVRGYGRGSRVFTPKDFLDLGSRAAVDQALSRFVKMGQLRRIKRGLYDFPRWSGILNRLAPPNIEAAVEAVVRRDGIQVMPDGIVAANNLGLTNAVPAKASYLTSGSTRTLKIGDRTVRFQHASPWLMAWVGHPSAPVVQALHWLGKDIASSVTVVEALKSKICDDMKQDLIKAIDLLPIWMATIVRKIAQDQRTFA